MRKFINALKPKNENGNGKFRHKTSQGILYVAYLNKPLINLSAMTGHYTDDYYDTCRQYSASVYTTSDGSGDGDKIPVILSKEDEMMCNEYY